MVAIRSVNENKIVSKTWNNASPDVFNGIYQVLFHK